MNRWKPLKRRLRFYLLRAVFGALSLLPRPAGVRAFGILGRWAGAILRTPREQILANTRHIFPDWDERTRIRFARRVFRNLGRNGFDFIRLHRYSEDDIRRLAVAHGFEHLEACYARGRGVIALGAHTGCWELLPHRLRAAGFQVAVVYRNLRDPHLDAYVAARRRRAGIETHDRDTGGRGILRSLRDGGLVGILTDQKTRVDSVRVPFMGQPAWTPLGPARLAMRTGAAVVPLVAYLGEDGRHVHRAGAEIPIERAAKGASRQEVRRLEEENTSLCNARLGEMILEQPDQWVWIHPRWDE